MNSSNIFGISFYPLILIFLKIGIGFLQDFNRIAKSYLVEAVNGHRKGILRLYYEIIHVGIFFQNIYCGS